MKQKVEGRRAIEESSAAEGSPEQCEGRRPEAPGGMGVDPCSRLEGGCDRRGSEAAERGRGFKLSDLVHPLGEFCWNMVYFLIILKHVVPGGD